MKSKHLFKITVEALTDETQNHMAKAPPLEFQVGNHDNILEIVQKMRSSDLFDENSATSFTVGLKLFTEVLLQNKDNPLFDELRPAISAFMKKLKTQIKTAQEKNNPAD